MNKTEEKKQLVFSIIVCSYNAQDHIGKAINSLLKQDYPKNRYEIIVVDDGSKDKTTKIVKKYPVKLIIHKENKGVAAARNTGLKEAKGEIYVCFDDDCYVKEDWLKNLYKVYKDNRIKSISGVGGLIELPKNTTLVGKYLKDSGYGNPSPKHFIKNKNIFSRFASYLKNMFQPHMEENRKIFEVGEIWGANCSFPVAVIKEVNGWDERLSGVEDTDLCNRIKKKFPKRKFLCTKEAILYHDDSLSLKEFLLKPLKRGKAIFDFYVKNKKIPPLFPFPIVLSAFLIAIAFLKPLFIIPAFVLLPQILYAWWPIKAVKTKSIYPILFPYIQLAQELSTILGLVKGFFYHIRFSKEKIILVFLSLSTIISLYGTLYSSNTATIFSSVYALFVPGILVSWILKIKYQHVWELLTYSLGISISFIMLVGLGINYGLPHYHVTQYPLTLIPVATSFAILPGAMIIYLFIVRAQFPLQELPRVNWKSILLSIIPTTFPFLSIIGAISLNNNASNISTLIMLGSIGAYVLFLTILRDKVEKGIFIYSLFSIALSLLFMTSLRGWYVTGHDIMLETYVFQLTKNHKIWSMVLFQDPYMACLSITILPTILSLLTHIPDFYIYKILFQTIFAFLGVGTYLFLEKFIDRFLAFLGTFIILSLPTFMTDMPMLNRQEIALLYFTLLLTTLFSKHFTKRLRIFLFILFSLGMLFSHYSTTYLAIIVFAGTYLVHIVLSLVNLHHKSKAIAQKIYQKLGFLDTKSNLHVIMVIFLVVTTTIWNVNITNTSSGIVKTVAQIFKNLHSQKKVSINPYDLKGVKSPTDQMYLDIYVSTTNSLMHKFNDDTAFIKKAIYNQYQVYAQKEKIDNITKIGKFLSGLKINSFSANDLLKQLYAKIIQIFIIVGFFGVFLLKKYISNFEKEYYILTIVFFAILILKIALPSGSIDYGLLRLFQQGMILFSVPLIIGGLLILSIFDKIHKSIKIYLLTGIIVFFFFYLSGFIPQITGGYYPQLNVSNGGFYYDAYYTHTTDIKSISWLARYRNPKTPIQSDWLALNKIHAYEGFYSFDPIIPSSIRINSYVFLSTFNMKNNEFIAYVNGSPIYYTFNFDYFDKNKNLIYNNGGSKIYR